MDTIVHESPEDFGRSHSKSSATGAPVTNWSIGEGFIDVPGFENVIHTDAISPRNLFWLPSMVIVSSDSQDVKELT